MISRFTFLYIVLLISECPPNDALCEQDKIGYDAIQHLHLQIDDDHDGNLDRSENDEVFYYIINLPNYSHTIRRPYFCYL